MKRPCRSPRTRYAEAGWTFLFYFSLKSQFRYAEVRFGLCKSCFSKERNSYSRRPHICSISPQQRPVPSSYHQQTRQCRRFIAVVTAACLGNTYKLVDTNWMQTRRFPVLITTSTSAATVTKRDWTLDRDHDWIFSIIRTIAYVKDQLFRRHGYLKETRLI